MSEPVSECKSTQSCSSYCGLDLFDVTHITQILPVQAASILRGDDVSPQRERGQHSQARMFISRQQKLQSHKRPTIIRKCFCNILLSEGSSLKVSGDSG